MATRKTAQTPSETQNGETQSPNVETSKHDASKLQTAKAIRTAPAWRPDANTDLTGRFIGVRLAENEEFGKYPVLTFAALRQIIGGTDEVYYDEGQQYYAVHAFHSTLQASLLEIKPVKNEIYTISYHGMRESNDSAKAYAAAIAQAGNDDGKKQQAERDRMFYHLYSVLVGWGDDDESSDETEVDWSAFTGGREDEPKTPPVGAPGTE